MGAGGRSDRRRRRPVDWSETIPRLQHVFGGDPGWWLNAAPGYLLRAYLTMLPRLEAQRVLTDINAMGAAFGGMGRFERQRYLARLQRAANGDNAAPVQATPEALQAMGVSVVIAPAKEGHDG